MSIKFTDVGRNKKTWTADIENSFDAIETEVNKSGALKSRNIEAVHGSKTNGLIFAGAGIVGRFEVVK